MGYLGECSWIGTFAFTCGRLFRRPLLAGHLCIQFKQFFQSFGVVFEAATDVDAFENFVVEIVGLAHQREFSIHAIAVIHIGVRVATPWECRGGEVVFTR